MSTPLILCTFMCTFNLQAESSLLDLARNAGKSVTEPEGA